MQLKFVEHKPVKEGSTFSSPLHLEANPQLPAAGTRIRAGMTFLPRCRPHLRDRHRPRKVHSESRVSSTAAAGRLSLLFDNVQNSWKGSCGAGDSDGSAADTQSLLLEQFQKKPRPVAVLVLSSYPHYFVYAPPEAFGCGV